MRGGCQARMGPLSGFVAGTFTWSSSGPVWSSHEHDLNMITSDPQRVVELRRRLASLSLGLNGEYWLETVSNFGRWFKRAAGGRISLASAALRSGRRWFQGQRVAKTAFVCV
jgi:hypothetical protein